MTFGLAFLLWSGGADAAECWFDGPPQVERSEAVAMSRTAREHGYETRVVRRSGDQGWEYLVRVEGLVCRVHDDHANPLAAASKL